MLKKIGFVTAGVVLATFVMGRVESLAAHRGFGGSLAWAQQWDDSAGDTSPQDDDSMKKSPPPDVSGTYSGTIEDHRFGAGTISATISQSGSKLSGSWDATFGGPGTLKGTVKSNGAITARLKIKGGCGLNAHGTFESGDEISGTYQVTGCGRSDHGTFDMTD